MRSIVCAAMFFAFVPSAATAAEFLIPFLSCESAANQATHYSVTVSATWDEANEMQVQVNSTVSDFSPGSINSRGLHVEFLDSQGSKTGAFIDVPRAPDANHPQVMSLDGHSTVPLMNCIFSDPAYGVDLALNETVIFIPAHFTDGDASLEATLYHPNSKPPWPLVVFNHGADGSLPSFHKQPRERPLEIAKFFLNRGYAVIAPMREGFAQSSGTVASFQNVFNCNQAQDGLFYARDIKATIDFLVGDGQAITSQILVIGQSNGGVVTLGYGASNPVARGVINISGGINELGAPDQCQWQEQMLQSATTLGAKTSIPSLWLYAEDDQTFPPAISQPFFNNFKAAGAKASFKLFPSGGHGFALAPGSMTVWGSTVDGFLSEIHLPNKVTGSL